MQYIIGIDSGGTKTIIKVADEYLRPLIEIRTDGFSINTHNADIIYSILDKAINSSLSGLKLKIGDCAGVCLGAAGVDNEECGKQYLQILQNIGFTKNISVFNDCELILRSHVDKTGAVIISGTGSIILGKDNDNRIVRVGGWGHILSDEGSAYYIVSEALKKVIRYYDGREGCEILADQIANKTGLKNAHEISQFVNKNILNKKEIACLAELVVNAMELGDKSALKIIDQAVEELYDGLKTTLMKLKVDKNHEITIVFWGSVLLKCSYISVKLKNKILMEYRNANIVIPDTDAAQCALKIAASHVN